MKRTRRDKEKFHGWKDVRDRLRQSLAAMEESVKLSPDHAKRIMDDRARALARVPTPSRAEGDTIEVLTFALAKERYAIESNYVREVIPLTDFTSVPGSPDFIVGVTNLRGEILPIIDLRKFFAVPGKGLTDLSRVLVLGKPGVDFGVLADETYEVVHLLAAELLDPPGTVAGVGREYLRGVTKDALIVLDGSVLLKDPRLFAG
jgi:purine-binding chemotaxis protein CheW